MQIGDFKDWNIENSNNEKISSKNVSCEERPSTPRGGIELIAINFKM